MTLSEKVAYLRGLEEGLNLNENAPETKLFSGMTTLLSDMSEQVETLTADLEEFARRLEEIDYDLGALERELLTGKATVTKSPLYEVECPTCGEVLSINEAELRRGEISCPRCRTQLVFDLSDD